MLNYYRGDISRRTSYLKLDVKKWKRTSGLESIGKDEKGPRIHFPVFHDTIAF